MKSNIKILLFAFLLAIISQTALAKPAHRRVVAPEPEPTIHFKGYYSSDKARRGSVVRAAVVLDIPDGYHVNANKPLGKYAIPTTVKIEGPNGVTVGPIAFPRAIVRKLKATNNESLAVYEGKAIMRFNVTVPANYSGGSGEIKGKLRFQACNDESCFPPVTREVKMWLNVE